MDFLSSVLMMEFYCFCLPFVMESIEIKHLLAFSSERGEARLQLGQPLFDHLHIMSKFIVVNILLVSL